MNSFGEYHDLPSGRACRVLSLLEKYQHVNPRMRNVSRQLGELLFKYARQQDGDILEIGTSKGYSAIWLGAAAEQMERTVTSFEKHPFKAKLARQAIKAAGLAGTVQIVDGQAEQMLKNLDGEYGMLFMDVLPEDYCNLMRLSEPHLSDRAIVVADNLVSRRSANGRGVHLPEAGQEFYGYLHWNNRVISIEMLENLGSGVVVARFR